jgi:hypothetical protein
MRRVVVLVFLLTAALLVPVSASAGPGDSPDTSVCDGVPKAGGLYRLCVAGVAVGCDLEARGSYSQPCQNIFDNYDHRSGGDIPPWAGLCNPAYTYCISGTLGVDNVGYPDGVANKSGDFDHLLNVHDVEVGLAFDVTPSSCSEFGFEEYTRDYSITGFELAFRGDPFLEDTFGPAVAGIGSVDIMYLTDWVGDIGLDIHLADSSVTGYAFELFLGGLDLDIDATDSCPVLAPLPAARTQSAYDYAMFRNFTPDWPFPPPGGGTAYFRDYADGTADFNLE